MGDVDVKALRELAEAQTLGRDRIPKAEWIRAYDCQPLAGSMGRRPVVLAILDRLEAAEARAEAMLEERNNLSEVGQQWVDRATSYAGEAVAFKERAEGLLKVAVEALENCTVLSVADCADCAATRHVAHEALARIRGEEEK